MAQYVMTEAYQSLERLRLDLQHQIWLLTLSNRLHLSNIPEEASSILDIGTGTGVWAIAMAAERASAHIIATDLTSPQVEAPQNVEFLNADADQPWPFAEAFDFIHARMLTSGIHDWPRFLAQCWAQLKPGGQLELLDVTHPWRAEDAVNDNESSAFIKFGHAVEHSWSLCGLDYHTTEKHVERLSKLGFVQIEETQLRWPLGHWSDDPRERKIGILVLENFQQFLKMAGRKILGRNPDLNAEQIELLVSEANQDLSENCCRKRLYLKL